MYKDVFGKSVHMLSRQLKRKTDEYVAKYEIKKTEQGKFYIVPKIDVKIAKLGAKLLPTSIISKISYKMQERKIKK